MWSSNAFAWFSLKLLFSKEKTRSAAADDGRIRTAVLHLCLHIHILPGTGNTCQIPTKILKILPIMLALFSMLLNAKMTAIVKEGLYPLTILNTYDESNDKIDKSCIILVKNCSQSAREPLHLPQT